jgi:hypothetical protein
MAGIGVFSPSEIFCILSSRVIGEKSYCANLAGWFDIFTKFISISSKLYPLTRVIKIDYPVPIFWLPTFHHTHGFWTPKFINNFLNRKIKGQAHRYRIYNPGLPIQPGIQSFPRGSPTPYTPSSIHRTSLFNTAFGYVWIVR